MTVISNRRQSSGRPDRPLLGATCSRAPAGSVRVWDPVPAQREAAPALDRTIAARAAGARPGDDAAAAAARVQVVATLEEAVRRPIRAGERPETARGQARHLRRPRRAAPPQCVLASSTSAIVASQFTEALAGRARCIVAHPVNPPHLVPVVELCGAPWTSDETKRAREEVMAASARRRSR
jgi:3-hydroxyacyl-CoA dehydrogenase